MPHPVAKSTAAPSRASRAVVLMAAAVYLGLPAIRNVEVPTAHRFVDLARSMLDGRVSIDVPVQETPFELIPVAGEAGRYYVAYPPLPALVLLPFVALTSAHVGAFACRLACILAVLLFDAFVRRAWPRIYGQPIRDADRFLLTLGFAFGTALWDTAARAGDWHFAHACAVAGMLAALVEYFGRRRHWLVGTLWGVGMLARPTIALSGLFFFFIAWREKNIRQLGQLLIGPVCAALILAGYNAIRFGTPLDFHYDEMYFIGAAADLMRRYGQFNGAFIPRNFFWFFLAPPAPTASGRFPWLAYDPYGMSLILASPFLVYGAIGIKRCGRESLARPAVAASLICLLPLLMYFNTGFWQFGHRFSLDYLPIWMVAVMVGLGSKLTRLARALIVAAIAVNIWGISICGMDSIGRLPETLRMLGVDGGS